MVKEEYSIESIIKSREGGEISVHIVDYYKPGDMHSCYTSIKKIVDKIYDVIDEIERTNELFDSNIGTDLLIKITLRGPKGQEIYSTVCRDEAIFYIKDLLLNMNYLI